MGNRCKQARLRPSGGECGRRRSKPARRSQRSRPKWPARRVSGPENESGDEVEPVIQVLAPVKHGHELRIGRPIEAPFASTRGEDKGANRKQHTARTREVDELSFRFGRAFRIGDRYRKRRSRVVNGIEIKQEPSRPREVLQWRLGR